MYRYDEFDAQFVKARNDEFRNQVNRRLSGALSEDEFKAIRLRNGLYLQLHAYMLRVAIPYGTLSSVQLNALAEIADKYDKGYGHFTTRQNIQFNWVKLIDAPDILEDLARVEMHAIQTSGNCIRNVTSDHFAGIAKDEITDPRPIAELIRQWSSNHPEFSYLGRKFKIAVIASANDRAAIRSNDVGIEIVKSGEQFGAKIYAGGGLGRTPIVGKLVREFVPLAQLLNYLEALLRVFNLLGRRDNKYKARIKILVQETGLDEIISLIEQEFKETATHENTIEEKEIARISQYFAPRELKSQNWGNFEREQTNGEFARFVANNCFAHRHNDYVALCISLKPIGGIPGDVTSRQMRFIAQLAAEYSLNEIRVTHTQNLVLPYIAKANVFEVWEKLQTHGLAEANINKISDIIACPGLDYCALATARSIPIAQEIAKHLREIGLDEEIGNASIKISGCINACGHHHIGNIGILGLEKAGRENYQITIGGNAGTNMKIGERIGPGIDAKDVPRAIEALLRLYLKNRQSGEEFEDTQSRIGIEPFKSAFANFIKELEYASA